mmetsp:Transcript_7545/g.30582  ORF Transcript_7545/g.30582 Transcript_7545/m.30582 type:complete len:237 (-) Transcript_7545:581-1291(-)
MKPFSAVATRASDATPASHSSQSAATLARDSRAGLAESTTRRHASASRRGSTTPANSTFATSVSSHPSSSRAYTSGGESLGVGDSPPTTGDSPPPLLWAWTSPPRKHARAAAMARAGSANTLASAPATRSTRSSPPHRLRVARIHARRVWRYKTSARSALIPSTTIEAASADAIVARFCFGDSSAFRAARAICALNESSAWGCCLRAGNFLNASSRVRCGGSDVSTHAATQSLAAT